MGATGALGAMGARVGLGVGAWAALAALAMGACFPGPLPLDADGAEAPDTTIGAETDATVAEVSSETSDADGGEVASEVEVSDAVDAADTIECDGDGDCDRLDGACAEGRCDGGRCVGEPLTGGECDDGDRCTTGDVCSAGVCAGSAVVCAALDQCHDAGACDPDTGQCTNPSKDNVTPCDDGDVCTYGDTCQAGVCVPGREPNDLNGDRAVGFSGDGDVRAQGLALDTDGDAKVLLVVDGPELRFDSVDDTGVVEYPMPEGAARTLVVVELRRNSMDVRSIQVVAHTTRPDSHVDGSRDLVILQDGSMVVSGAFRGEFLLGEPPTLTAGTSPSGFAIEGGVFVARMSPAVGLMWSRQYLGALDEPDEIAVPIMRYSTPWTLHGIAVTSGALLEIVHDGQSEEVIEPQAAGISYFEGLTITGHRSVRGRVAPSEPDGFAYLVDVSQHDDGLMPLGVTEGGTTTLFLDEEASPGFVVATGVSDTADGWIIRSEQVERTFLHLWSVYLDRSGVVIPTAATADRAWVAFDLVGRLYSRGIDEVVTDHATFGRRHMALMRLNASTLAWQGLLTSPGFFFVSRMVSGPRGGVILTGHYESALSLGSPPDGTLAETFDGQGLALLGIAADEGVQYALNLARRDGAGAVADTSSLDPLPVVLRNDGVVLVAGTATFDAIVGVTAIAPPPTSTSLRAFVLALNSEGGLLCPTVAP